MRKIGLSEATIKAVMSLYEMTVTKDSYLEDF